MELRRVLHNRGHSLAQLQASLSKALPNIIAIPFTPGGSQNHVDAVLTDIVMRLQTEQKRQLLEVKVEGSKPVQQASNRGESSAPERLEHVVVEMNAA